MVKTKNNRENRPIEIDTSLYFQQKVAQNHLYLHLPFIHSQAFQLGEKDIFQSIVDSLIQWKLILSIETGCDYQEITIINFFLTNGPTFQLLLVFLLTTCPQKFSF